MHLIISVTHGTLLYHWYVLSQMTGSQAQFVKKKNCKTVIFSSNPSLRNAVLIRLNHISQVFFSLTSFYRSKSDEIQHFLLLNMSNVQSQPPSNLSRHTVQAAESEHHAVSNLSGAFCPSPRAGCRRASPS